MKVLLLTFEENEEDTLTRILSCIGNRTEILEYEDKGILQFEGLCIDKYKRNVVREENEIELTYTEFEILLLLAQNAGVVGLYCIAVYIQFIGYFFAGISIG